MINIKRKATQKKTNFIVFFLFIFDFGVYMLYNIKCTNDDISIIKYIYKEG